ncbi:MAG: hypothetical protein ABSC76_02135 [Terracidiphilus sp.]
MRVEPHKHHVFPVSGKQIRDRGKIGTAIATQIPQVDGLSLIQNGANLGYLRGDLIVVVNSVPAVHRCFVRNACE